MKNLIYLFVFIFFVTQGVYGQKEKKAKWTDYDNRESAFPKSIYVMGFTSEIKRKEDALKDVTERLKSEARI